jgi:biopolymer transport protein ExbD
MKFTTEHKTINTFHFSSALNVIMILLVFIVMIFAYYGKSGVRIMIDGDSERNKINNVKNVVMIDDRDKVFINQEELTAEKMLERFTSIKMNKINTLYIHPSKSARFSTIVSVISTAKKVGINNITVQTDLASF